MLRLIRDRRPRTRAAPKSLGEVRRIATQGPSDQQVTILVALRIYCENYAEQVARAPFFADYFSNVLSRIEEAEKVVKTMEIEDANKD